jgi:PAP2 superfamily
VGKPAPSPLHSYEWALAVLGGGTLAALIVRAGPLHPATVETSVAVALYLTAIVALRQSGAMRQKLRFVAAYAYVVWFYGAVARITPALGTPLRDADLYAVDRALFSDTPAVWLQRHSQPWLTDLFSAGYLSYLVYLNVVVAHAVVQPASSLPRLATPLFWAYAIGLTGYLLVPAVGPAAALSDAFATSLEGGPLTRLNDAVIGHASSVYDVFPSLHVLITCVLLDHDWHFARRRFWIMLLPAGLLVGSTLYLRYHYAIDLVAGFALFLGLRVFLGLRIMRPCVGGVCT